MIVRVRQWWVACWASVSRLLSHRFFLFDRAPVLVSRGGLIFLLRLLFAPSSFRLLLAIHPQGRLVLALRLPLFIITAISRFGGGGALLPPARTVPIARLALAPTGRLLVVSVLHIFLCSKILLNFALPRQICLASRSCGCRDCGGGRAASADNAPEPTADAVPCLNAADNNSDDDMH